MASPHYSPAQHTAASAAAVAAPSPAVVDAESESDVGWSMLDFELPTSEHLADDSAKLQDVLAAIRARNADVLRALLRSGNPNFWACVREACSVYSEDPEHDASWLSIMAALLQSRGFTSQEHDLAAGVATDDNPLAEGLIVALREGWNASEVHLLARIGAPFTDDVLRQVLSSAHKLQPYLDMLARECGAQIPLVQLRHALASLLEQASDNDEDQRTPDAGDPRPRPDSAWSTVTRARSARTMRRNAMPPPTPKITAIHSRRHCALRFLLCVFFYHHLPMVTSAHWTRAFQQMLDLTINDAVHDQVKQLLDDTFHSIGRVRVHANSYVLWCTDELLPRRGRCANWQCPLAHTPAEFFVLNPEFRVVSGSMLPLPVSTDCAECSLYQPPAPAAVTAQPARAHLLFHVALTQLINQPSSTRRSNLAPLNNLLLALQSMARELQQWEQLLPADFVKPVLLAISQDLHLYKYTELYVALRTATRKQQAASPQQQAQLAAAAAAVVSKPRVSHASAGAGLASMFAGPQAVLRLPPAAAAAAAKPPLSRARPQQLTVEPSSARSKQYHTRHRHCPGCFALLAEPGDGPFRTIRHILSLLPHAALHDALSTFAPGLLHTFLLSLAAGSKELSCSINLLPAFFKLAPLSGRVIRDVTPMWGRFSLAPGRTPTPFTFSHLKHEMHDMDDVVKALMDAGAGKIDLVAREHTGYGQKLLWLTPCIKADTAAADIPAGVPSLRDDESRFGAVRVSFPIALAFATLRWHALGTRLIHYGRTVEVAHDLLLSEHVCYAVGDPFKSAATVAFAVSDCKLPHLHPEPDHHAHAGPVQWARDSSTAVWLCSRAAADCWDQLRFAIFMPSLQLGAQQQVKIDFIAHSDLCAFSQSCSAANCPGRCTSRRDAIGRFVAACIRHNYNPSLHKHLFSNFAELQDAYEAALPPASTRPVSSWQAGTAGLALGGGVSLVPPNPGSMANIRLHVVARIDSVDDKQLPRPVEIEVMRNLQLFVPYPSAASSPSTTSSPTSPGALLPSSRTHPSSPRAASASASPLKFATPTLSSGQSRPQSRAEGEPQRAEGEPCSTGSLDLPTEEQFEGAVDPMLTDYVRASLTGAAGNVCVSASP